MIKPNKEIIEEGKRLTQMILESDEELTIDEFVMKYGSPEYKTFYVKIQVEKEKQFKEGFIVD